MKTLKIVLLVIVGLLSPLIRADVEVFVALGDPSVVPVQLIDPVSISRTESSVPPLLEFGMASADLTSGVIRAQANGYLSVATGTRARVSDIFTITGPAGSTAVAQIRFQITGSTTSLTNSPAALGEAVAIVRSRSMIRQLFGSTLAQGLLVDFVHTSRFFHQADGAGGVTILPSFTFDDFVTHPAEIRPGTPNPVQTPSVTILQPSFVLGSPSERGYSAIVTADLIVSAGQRFEIFNQIEPSGAGTPGGAANMSNSGYISITLPSGWGYTSDSGVLLSDPPELPSIQNPNVTVPLPMWSLLLLASILSGLGLVKNKSIKRLVKIKNY